VPETVSMYGNSKKAREAALRSAEYRKLEDESPRLSARVPLLTSLQIEVTQRGLTGTSKHKKLVVVTRSPALFTMACGQPACIDGGHDITREVMYALERGHKEYEGESACRGTTGSAPCSGVITYTVSAEFRDPKSSNHSAV
jgi:hypothetical protein